MYTVTSFSQQFLYSRYDPYDRTFTHELYDHVKMRENRQEAIEQASKAQVFGIVLGTLGRQGSLIVLEVGI